MKTILILCIPIVVSLVLSMVFGSGRSASSDLRPPVVAGQFYSSDPDQLRSTIRGYLKKSPRAAVRRPLVIVAPHAGYVFSGQVCANAYRQVSEQAVEVAVVLGTNHTTAPFPGVSLFARGAFRTPLGDAKVEEDIARTLLAEEKYCTADPVPHLREHSIEVQVPFIQVLWPQARIVPAVVGSADPEVCERFGAALARLLKNRPAIIIASSDLSHYPRYEDAVRIDRQTLEAITTLSPREFSHRIAELEKQRIPELGTCACGEAPIMVAIAAARALGAKRGTVVSYANSGDVPIGERDRVVGYGAVVFEPEETARPAKPAAESVPDPALKSTGLSAEERQQLLRLARVTLEQYFKQGRKPLPAELPERLRRPAGAFVTLHQQGRLRGCIGHMTADAPLGETVASMALEAAFNDPRFAPVTEKELTSLEIEISVLTPASPITSPAQIRLGRDGVILRKGFRTAVFLPQVATEYNWGLEEMLDQLCRKAGLSGGCWKEGVELSIFQAEIFSEKQPPRPS